MPVGILGNRSIGRLQGRLGIETLCVRARIPFDPKFVAGPQDVLEGVGDDRDTGLQGHHVDDAGTPPDLGLIPALRPGELYR